MSKQGRPPGLYVVFDGPPGPESGRFIEVEDHNGKSVGAPQWHMEDGGQWALGPFLVERRQFKLLLDDKARAAGCPQSIPWDAIAPCESQALANHDQTLERLNERGGLSPLEAYAVLTGQRFRAVAHMKDADVIPMMRLLARESCR